jgi:hypothetical protein
MATGGGSGETFLGGISIEFFLFALILIGVAVFHKQTFWVKYINQSQLSIFALVIFIRI